MSIFIMRHGETDWNVDMRLQGCTDIPLNENGRSQIRQSAKTLSGFSVRIDAIWTSSLGRAQESARIVAQEIGYKQENIVIETEFREREFGEAEGLKVEEVHIRFPDGNYPGMETPSQAGNRARKAFEKCLELNPDKNILIVAHGGIIKNLLWTLTGGTIRYRGNGILDNGGFLRLEPKEGGYDIYQYVPAMAEFEKLADKYKA